MSTYENTELGNAKRFVAIAGDHYKWVPEMKSWFRWDGNLWKVDDDGAAIREIESVLELIASETAAVVEQLKQAEDEEEQKALRAKIGEFNAWRKKSQAQRSIQAMLALAQSQSGVSAPFSQFDSKGHYLGVGNGVVDLRNGEVHSGDKNFLMTKRTNVPYVSDAPCPMWEQFLDKIMLGDTEMIDFLQRLAGSAAVGRRGEWFTFFYGKRGANGKSTFVDTLNTVLGDYASVGDPRIVTEQKSNAEYHLAQMKGLRMVVFNEVNKEDVQLSEALIKMTTDSGEIVARHPMGRPFAFQPTFTPIFCVNHLPQASMDPALWRRLLIVPFNYRFEGDEKDPQFGAKLIEQEAQGILSWVVEGAKKYLTDGLHPPEVLKQAVSTFQAEIDVLGTFIKDNYFEVPGESVRLPDVRTAFVDWARSEGFRRDPSALTFRRDMEDRGFEVKKGTGNYWYIHGLSDSPVSDSSAKTSSGPMKLSSTMLDFGELKRTHGGDDQHRR